MALIDVAAVAREAMGDPEFSREMRFFDGKIEIDVEGEPTVLEFADGELVGTSGSGGEDAKVVVRGDGEHWRNLLAPYPKPFYQCLQTTTVKHGMYMSSTNETFAYLPALNRLVVLMRGAYDDVEAADA